MYTKTAKFCKVSRTCSIFLYSTVRPIFCICLQRHCIKWIFTTSNNGIWKDLIYCSDGRCFKTDLYNFWWPESHVFTVVSRQRHVCFVSGKSANITGHVQLSNDVLPRSACNIYSWVNYFEKVLDTQSGRGEWVPILSKYSKYSEPNTKIINPESSVWSVRRKLGFMCKGGRFFFSRKQIFEMSSRFYRGADKSLALPTSRFILFDGENISFDASLVIYI